MGLKIFTVLLVLFIAELTFLATKDPKALTQEKRDFATADISFSTLKGISLTLDGVKNRLEASKVNRFKDHLNLYNIKAFHKDENLTHNIQAKSATYKDDNVSFKDSVKYKNSDDLHIFTQLLEYNIAKKEIVVNSPFTMRKDGSKLEGIKLFYDTKNRRLSVEKPHFFSKGD
jgi:LPS export ABC transporter protein LptC